MTIPENIVSAVKSLLAPYGDFSALTAESLAALTTPQEFALVSKKEAAQMLCCSRMTILRLVQSGHLEGYKRNKCTLAISRQSVMDYIASMKINSQAS